jgi:hypothetical protein
MSALSTNYGAPAKENKATAYAVGTGSGQSGKLSSANNFSLVSMPTGSRLGKGKAAEPVTRWDRMEHQASVVSGDQQSVGSTDSKRQIITKHTDWAVEYDRQSRSNSRSSDRA